MRTHKPRGAESGSAPLGRHDLAAGRLRMPLIVTTLLVLFAFWPWSPRHAQQDGLLETGNELRSTILGARERALSSGTPVAVLIYPDFETSSHQRGRVIVYQDACRDFFTRALACGVAYATYDPAVPAYGHAGSLRSKVISTLDLPAGVTLSPRTGIPATLSAPFAGVRIDLACSFCGSTGGAVQFDSQGHPSFYSLDGGAVTGPFKVTGGATLSLRATPTAATTTAEEQTLMILASTGAVAIIASDAAGQRP